MIPFVVTGMPKSSTKWTAQVLTLAGFGCTHEYVFDRWGDDVMQRAGAAVFGDCSWIAAPFLSELQAAGVPTVLLVRDPLAVASSLCGPAIPGFTAEQSPPFMDWAGQHVPGIKMGEGSDPDRAVRWWIGWTRLAAVSADLILTAPIVRHDLERVGRLLGGGVAPSAQAALDLPASNSTPGAGPPRLTWDDVDAGLARVATDLWEQTRRVAAGHESSTFE